MPHVFSHFINECVVRNHLANERESRCRDPQLPSMRIILGFGPAKLMAILDLVLTPAIADARRRFDVPGMIALLPLVHESLPAPA